MYTFPYVYTHINVCLNTCALYISHTYEYKMHNIDITDIFILPLYIYTCVYVYIYTYTHAYYSETHTSILTHLYEL